MTRSPILRVLSSIRRHRVKALLMGGQACVLYGAAEFSRDVDLAVSEKPEDLERLRRALEEMEAERIAVPPLRREYLERGLAVHFRCRHPEAQGIRIDVMSRLRGVDPFPSLWERRTTLEVEGGPLEVMALPDLVRAKKTQRDKDWPMVRRLLEAHYLTHREEPTPERVRFWLEELRTPALLVEAVRRFPEASRQALPRRPLLELAAGERYESLEEALREEERRERERDRRYWEPRRRELQRLRQAR